jgi:DNA-binding GntR family transcriptional regulator
VRPPAPASAPPPGRQRVSWIDVIEKQAARRGTEIRFGSAVPPALVAQALKLAPGAAAPFFIRVLTDSAGPRAGLKRYVRPDLLSLLTRKRRNATNFAAALARAARATLACSSFWAEAILAEPRFAMILKVPLGSPVLSLWWVESLAGEPAVCSQMLQPGPNVAVEFSPPPRR